jgi:hypothetical protein
MPTPFMHLHIAEQILEQTSVKGNGRLHTLLMAEWPAFYLGSVAPDVNAISDISREGTHFYKMPPAEEEMAYPTLLKKYPQLNNLPAISSAQAVCVAAYSAHLMLDLIWLREVVYPYFYLPKTLGSRQQREIIHFTLLTYLDTLALQALPKTAVSTLAAATDRQYLPFIEDVILYRWRDMLVAQLQPNEPIKTVEIYAERLGIAAPEFEANMQNSHWMQTHLFDQIPVGKVQAILQAAVPQSLDLISNYLKDKLSQ